MSELLRDSDFVALAGRSFDNDNDAVFAMNADWGSSDTVITGTVYQQSDKTVYVSASKRPSGWVRVNYVAVLA